MRYFKIFSALIISLTSIPSVASNALGDANDETSFYLWDGGAISANFKDKSAKIGYFFSKSDMPLGFGITLKGRSTNNKSIIFDGDEVTPETELAIPIGYHWIFSEKASRDEPQNFIIDDWIFLNITYRNGQYQMVNPNLGFTEQLYKEELKTTALSLSYNAIVKGNFLIGTSFSVGKSNNYESLSKKEVKTISDVGSSEGSTRAIESIVSARQGDYKEFTQKKLNFDIMAIPNIFDNRLGIDLFARYIDKSANDDSVLNYGLGFFLLKEGSPTQIVGGVTYMRDDEENENLVGLVIGYNF